MTSKFTPELIAPCGMNCGICKNYLAFSRGIPTKRGKINHCSGCKIRAKNCYIKRSCVKLSKGKVKYCFECDEMPCKNLQHLDKRYRENYNMSMVENLKEIKLHGMNNFLLRQQAKYECPSCGDVLSVHDGKCYLCYRRKRVNLVNQRGLRLF